MWLNENSTREDILKYIKMYSFSFLSYHLDKPLAQPYIDEAAKVAVKESSYYFLRNFSDKPWAQPYIDDAVREVAKKYPQYFLEKLANRFPQGINLALFALGGKNVSR